MKTVILGPTGGGIRTVNIAATGPTGLWEVCGQTASGPTGLFKTVQPSVSPDSRFESLIVPGYTGGGGGGYVAKAVHFAAVDWISLNAGSGPATASTLLIAGWLGNMGPNTFFEIDTFGTNNAFHIQNNFSSGPDVSFGIQFYVSDADGNTIGALVADFPGLANFGVGWHSVAAALNTTTQVFQFYVDRQPMDVSAATWYALSDFALDWRAGDQGAGIGSNCYCTDITAGTGEVDVSSFIAQAGGAFFDLSIPANLDKLFSLTNKPVDWLADGSGPTGSVPQIFLSGDDTDYFSNPSGYTPFTPSIISDPGILTNATTSPSD